MTFGEVNAPRKSADGSRSALPVAMAYRNTIPHVLRSRRAVSYRPRVSTLRRTASTSGAVIGYRTYADRRIRKVEQPTLLREGDVGAPLPLELHQHLFGNSPEGVGTRRGQSFEPALRRGIDIVREQTLGVVAFVARVLCSPRWLGDDGRRL